MAAIVLAVLGMIVLVYGAAATFAMGCLSDGTRWPFLAVSAACAGGIIGLGAYILSRIDVDIV